jgi:SAM-dependent methyltransferase
MRDHDKLYLSDTKYFKKPKYVWILLSDLFNNKKKKITFLDIGCANGAFIFFLKKIFLNWNFVGTDINSKLVNKARKKTKCKIFSDDIRKKNFKNIKGDIVHAAGVHSIFPDIKKFLKNILDRTSHGGYVYIHGSFNPNNVDTIVSYRDCSKKNFLNRKIDQVGWNNFSIKTVSKILDKIGSVKKYHFYKVKFPKNLKVKRDVKDPMRSWTFFLKNKMYFMNSLNIVQDQYILIIKKR